MYVDARGEEMREYFVGGAAGEKKQLTVTCAGTRETVDFGHMAVQMAALLDENVKDKELKEWVMPAFSTTNDVDRVVGAVVLMASMKNYFTYGYIFSLIFFPTLVWGKGG